MIDPPRRWGANGYKPQDAGPATFPRPPDTEEPADPGGDGVPIARAPLGGLPYTEDPADVEGIDVAIVGAPRDELVPARPGTGFGPGAIRSIGLEQGRHREAGIDAFDVLRVVASGDAPIMPADPAASHAAI